MSLIKPNEYRRILLAVVLVAAASILTFTVFYLESRSRSEQAAAEGPPVTDPDVLEAVDEDEKAEVTLYFCQPGDSGLPRLVPRTRELFKTEAPQLMARQIVAEVIRGPEGDSGAPLFPPGTRVRQVFLLPDGTAVVDLPPEAARGLAGGAAVEYAALRCISRSLIENLEQVRRVKFLVGGKDASTFAGHISIRLPFM